MSRVNLLFKIDEQICKIYNISMYLRSLYTDKSCLKKNVTLKTIDHDFCFVIGNGPSLTFEDLEAIKVYPTFTVNFFHKGCPEFPSTYHVLLDPCFGNEECLPYVLDLYDSHSTTKFITRQNVAKQLLTLNKVDRIFGTYPVLAQYRDFVRCNMTKSMTGSVNVIPFAIQCALYMGYKNIFLLGCDFNSYANLKVEHFYKHGKDRMTSIGEDLRWSSFVHYHHYALQAYAQRTDCKIINLTPGSLIDAYPRNSLNLILNKIEKKNNDFKAY